MLIKYHIAEERNGEEEQIKEYYYTCENIYYLPIAIASRKGMRIE